MSSNIPQWRVGWENPGEGGAGSQGDCNMSNVPHLTVDIIIIINMGSNFTCTINCNYRTATTLSTQETRIVLGTQLKIPCIKDINTNTNTNTTNTNPKCSTIWRGPHVRKLVTFVIPMAKLTAKNKPVFYMRIIMVRIMVRVVVMMMMMMMMMMIIIIIIIVLEK
jgi:hypothetical protein